jgi:hypothetical protein
MSQLIFLEVLRVIVVIMLMPVCILEWAFCISLIVNLFA